MQIYTYINKAHIDENATKVNYNNKTKIITEKKNLMNKWR